MAEPAHGDTALEEEPDRWFVVVRRSIRCRPTLNIFYRGVVGLLGVAVVVVGLLLVPLPGPGWLIVFAGLAVLATEFAWAGRVLRFAQRNVSRWTRWAQRQALVVRVVGVVCFVAVAGAVWWYLQTYGVPGWLLSIG